MTDADDRTQPAAIVQLRALARRNLTGEAPKRNAASLDGVERALAQRRARRRRASLWAGSGVAALAGVLLLVGLLRRSDALAFEVLRGSLAPTGFIDGTEQHTLVRFSEGTELELAAQARARVGSVSPHGAEIELEHGRVNVKVVHLPCARWSVRAGAYLVTVTGTSFEVEFEPERRWLAIDLFTGSVSVSGPLINGGLVVSAGQRLMVLPEDSLVLVQRDVATAAAAVSPAPAQQPAAATDAIADPPSAPEAERPTPPRSSRSRSRGTPPRATGGARHGAAESWSQLVAAGRFDDVLRQAEEREFDRVYQQAKFEDLQALADAARYARRTAVAQAALLALRERFSASSAAREAAFFLGRLEDLAGAPQRALEWYDRYLSDSPNGTYASQALGRKLLIIDGQHGPEAARPLAREYLRRFPDGPYASAAQKLAAP